MDKEFNIAAMKRALQEGRVTIGIDHGAESGSFTVYDMPERERLLQGEWLPEPTRKYVLAGNRQQFMSWCYERGISPHDDSRAIFLSDPDRMRGCEIPSYDDIVIYGTFWERRDSVALMAAARERVRS